MNAHECTTCGTVGYTAATQPEDLAKLPCHACGAPPTRPEWQVANEVFGKIRNLFEGKR